MLFRSTTIDRDGYNVLHVSMGSQSGTHVDAPLHFLPDGRAIDSYSPEVFMGEASIADATTVPKNTAIGPDLIPEPDAPGGIIVIRTDWSKHWAATDYLSHPFLSAEAAQRIIDVGFHVVAIDALSIDRTEGNIGDFPAHEILLGAEVPICENLTNIAAVDWLKPWVSLLPLRIGSADGAPIRAVAFEFQHT